MYIQSIVTLPAENKMFISRSDSHIMSFVSRLSPRIRYGVGRADVRGAAAGFQGLGFSCHQLGDGLHAHERLHSSGGQLRPVRALPDVPVFLVCCWNSR